MKDCISIGFLLNRASQAIWRELGKGFKKEGVDLTPEQWMLLTQLWQADGQNQQELCKHTHKEKPSVTRLIDNLEKKGLVNRKPCKHDKRANLIFLTAKGQALKDDSMRIANRTFDAMFIGIDENERKICERILCQMAGNLPPAC